MKIYLKRLENMQGYEALHVHEEDIIVEYPVGGMIYISKGYTNILEDSSYEEECSDYSLSEEKAKDYLFIYGDDISGQLKELFLQYDKDIDWFNEDHGPLSIKDVEEELEELLQSKGVECEELNFQKVFYYFNGSNTLRVILEDSILDTVWEDWSEELSDHKEIDRRQKKTGHYNLIRSVQGELWIEYVSYYQGDGIRMLNLDKEMDIDEAIKYWESM